MGILSIKIKRSCNENSYIGMADFPYTFRQPAGSVFEAWFSMFLAKWQPIREDSISVWSLFIGLDYAHGPLVRYVKLRVAHAPGMPRVSDPGMHHSTCATHVPWCVPGSLTCNFLWSRCQGKRSRHSRSMHNSQFYVSDKRAMVI